MSVVEVPFEKQISVELDKVSAEGRVEDGSRELHVDSTLERKTVLKLDLLLVPMMCMIYLLAFLDRANIGNARVAGLQEDLGITDHQYQIGTIISPVLGPSSACD